MSKRFTDTGKWKKEWYRKLGSRMRDVWNYILDDCDFAGVWEIDLETLQHFTGQRVTLHQLQEAFGDRIIHIADKLFVPTFIEFQYGELCETVKPHQGVIKRLHKLGLYELYQNLRKGLGNPYVSVQDKDKDKDKDKEKGGYGGKTKTPVPEFDFESAYANYPRKVGKAAAIVEFKKQIKTLHDYELLLRAINRYRDHCEREKKESQYIQHFDTFIRPPKGGTAPRWRDWLEAETGTTMDFNSEAKDFDWNRVFADEHREAS